jgi:hypothetical protein
MKKHIKNEFSEVVRILSKPQKAQKHVKQISRNPRLKMASDFTMSLLDPFNPRSEGCRVPDIYSFPTSTYHSHGTFSIKANSAGNCGGIFLPNPNVSFIDTSQDNSQGSCVSASSMSLLPTYAYAGTTFANTAVYQATALSAAASSYRVSSWGIRITNLQAALSATGKLYVALVPCNTKCLSQTALSNIRDLNALTVAYTNQGTLATAAILALPVSRQITVSELITGGVTIPGRVINPTFYNFKTTNATGLLGNSPASEYMYDTTTNDQTLGTNNSYSEITSTPGGCNIVFFAEGIPAGTPAFDIEYIYHYETTPLLNTNQTSPVPSGTQDTHVGDSNIIEHSLNVANAQPPMRFLTEVEQTIGTVMGVAGKVYDASQSPIGRAVTSAMLALF